MGLRWLEEEAEVREVTQKKTLKGLYSKLFLTSPRLSLLICKVDITRMFSPRVIGGERHVDGFCPSSRHKV